MINFTVAGRLALIHLLVGLSVAVGCAVGWYALSEQDAAIEQIASLTDAGRYLQKADMMHDAIQSEVLSRLTGDRRSDVQQGPEASVYEQDAQAFLEAVERLARLPLPPEVKARVQVLHADVEAYLNAAAKVMAGLSTAPAEAKQHLPEFTLMFEKVLHTLEDLTSALAKHVSQSEAASLARNRVAKSYLVGAFGVTAVIALILVLITRSVRSSLQTLKRVVAVSKDIMAGNLDTRCSLTTHDEVGDLGRAIDGMADELRSTILTLRTEAEGDSFRSKLQAALEMADTEAHTCQVVARAMQEVSTLHTMELLLSNSSRSHLSRAVEHPAMGAPNCRVESPFECVAVRRGNLSTFADSEALDACPHLRDRVAPVSGVCVPISFMGRSLGVLHAAGPVGELPKQHILTQLETLGVQAGARIGTVRAFAQTQTQAATDSLTGLANRRAVETAVRRLLSMHQSYALILVDLDNFKRLNDTHGHVAGDDALRRFAKTAKACIRHGDMVARWGGEEFLLLLPDADKERALEVCGRIREQLATTVHAGKVPAFTASFGVVTSDPLFTFEQQLRAADHALYLSKANGRDQTTVGQVSLLGDTAVRRRSERTDALDLQRLAEET